MKEVRSTDTANHGYKLSPGWLTFLVGLVCLLVAGVLYQQSLIASGKAGAPAGASTATAAAGQLYTCPMHPQVVQDHPGTCPICGMELVPKTTEGDKSSVDLAALKEVHLSPTQEVLANVTPVRPVRQTMSQSVTGTGEVVVPQDQMRDVVAWQDGRIDNLVVAETGGVIRKGQHIMDVYSPDLVQAQDEYLIALKAADELASSSYASIAGSSRALVDASRQKMLRLGMTPQQLLTLERTRKAVDHVPIYAKEGGVVMDKKVSEGMYVMKGEELYSVAQLSPIWVEVKLFEQDAAKVKVGNLVRLKSMATRGKTFTGRIELIEPELEMETRTFKLRVSVPNRHLELRPGMVVDAEVDYASGEMLLLPRNAVVHTGDGDLVYVRNGDGAWEPRSVTVGGDFGDKIEIASGLSEKDTVAGTAAFLLDSEAQLKGVPRPVAGDQGY